VRGGGAEYPSASVRARSRSARRSVNVIRLAASATSVPTTVVESSVPNRALRRARANGLTTPAAVVPKRRSELPRPEPQRHALGRLRRGSAVGGVRQESGGHGPGYARLNAWPVQRPPRRNHHSKENSDLCIRERARGRPEMVYLTARLRAKLEARLPKGISHDR
jgi:hypothetical protein